jgi:hypothetical protein
MMRVPIVTELARRCDAVTHDDFADDLSAGTAETNWPTERRQTAARVSPLLRAARNPSGSLTPAVRA